MGREAGLLEGALPFGNGSAHFVSRGSCVPRGSCCRVCGFAVTARAASRWVHAWAPAVFVHSVLAVPGSCCSHVFGCCCADSEPKRCPLASVPIRQVRVRGKGDRKGACGAGRWVYPFGPVACGLGTAASGAPSSGAVGCRCRALCAGTPFCLPGYLFSPRSAPPSVGTKWLLPGGALRT